MSAPSQRTASAAVRAVALGLLLWPLVHWGLTRTIESDPWSLGGWAMYATPRPTVEVSYEADGKPCSVPQACQSELKRFLVWRKAFGIVVSPARLSACVSKHIPKTQKLSAFVSTSSLNGTTQRIETKTMEYGSLR